MSVQTLKGPMQVVGNYELVDKIAEGGMGAIYRGRHRSDGSIVAIKIMPPHMAANPVLLKRFEQEFKAASTLDHPNIVRAIEFGESGTSPFLVMEFIDGESLGQKIEREGKMAETEAIKIIAQVAQGLHRAHKLNLVHRDVKPDNILVSTDGVAKLADLGLVKETEADLNLTKTGRGLGTPHFMAPEQFRNAKNADARCDIYSLGATLYQMVTGVLPFKSTGPLDAWMKKIQNDLTPPKQIVPTLSDRVSWAILRAMSADADQRPKSCREFIEDLTGHSTRRVPTTSSSATADLWYLVYLDDEGNNHTVKGTTAAIRRSLKDGLLGDAENIRAGRTKAGPFESLRDYPEFRDMVVAAAPLQMPGVSPSRLDGQRPADRPSRPAAPAEAPAPQVIVAAPPKAVKPAEPHVRLKDYDPDEDDAVGTGWGMWALFVGLAVGTGLLAFFLLPRLMK